jgi:phosphoglycolate phosphatase
MVGDTTYDMEMAVNAGVRGLGVSWGYHAPARLLQVGAERVVQSSQELLRAIGEPLEALA